MIEKQKKQLFNEYISLFSILIIPLGGFFVYATIFNPSFFVVMSIGLIVVIAFILPLRNSIYSLETENDLKIQNFHERTNLIEDEIRKNLIAIKSFKEKIISFSQLKGLTESLSMCLSLEDTSKILSEEVNNLFGDSETTIILYLFQSKTGELGISSSHKGQMRVNIKSKKGDVFDQWVVKTMQPLLIEDTRSDYRFDADKIQTEDARTINSLISVPLMVGNKALGILRVDSPTENHFVMEDLRFLTTIGDLGALAIENAQLYERVEQLAIRDGLTNLYLRRYLLERLPEEISRQVRRKNTLSFLMIDLDFFKKYNDIFGHVAGDIVLRSVGLILDDFFKEPGNLVCRYGGEEFAVLLPDCPKKKAMGLAEKVREKIASETVLLRREKTHVTVSIGVASYPKDASMKEELIHKADQALYKAKEEGRNRVCVV